MATLKSIKNKYLTVSDGTALGVTTNTENISALSFKLATADNLSKFNLVDGFTDDYNDATGVDASGSTNDTRNAAGNYYTGTTSTWETGDRSSTITVTSTANTFRDPTSAQPGTAGTNQQFVNGSTTGNNTTDSMRQGINLTVAGRYIAFDLGSAKIVVDAKWYQSTGNGNGTWKWQADSQSNFASAVDVGGSFNLQATDGSNPYTQSWTSDLGSNVTAYRYWRLLGVSGNLTAATDQWIHELEFKVNVAGANMTLQSNAFTAQADPTTARIILDEWAYKGSQTLNTDIKAYASRDNGTTFSQITLADQGNLTPSGDGGIQGNTILMMHCDGANGGTTFTDVSSEGGNTAQTCTANGNAQTKTDQFKFGTASAYFDGTGDYVAVTGDAEQWAFASEDFTIDFWIRPGTSGSQQRVFGDLNSGGSAAGFEFIQGGDDKMGFSGSAPVGLAMNDPTVMTMDTWYHFAVTRLGNEFRMYRDGVSVATVTIAGGMHRGLIPIGIGRSGDYNAQYFEGYIDEVRIQNGIAVWSGATSFTPPVAPYSATRRLLSGSVDVSGQPAGSNVKYKITTHNQTADLQTRVYGTSMAWA